MMIQWKNHRRLITRFKRLKQLQDIMIPSLILNESLKIIKLVKVIYQMIKKNRFRNKKNKGKTSPLLRKSTNWRVLDYERIQNEIYITKDNILEIKIINEKYKELLI